MIRSDSLFPSVRKSPWVGTEKVLNCDFQYFMEGRPYILPNESNLTATYKSLNLVPLKQGAFHIGFSGWFNLDVIVARNSEGALLMDISNPVQEVLRATQEEILVAQDRYDFLDRFRSRMELFPSRYFRPDEGSSSLNIRNEWSRPGSWLATPEGFTKIRTLFDERRILHMRMDMADSKGWQEIGNWLACNKLYSDTLYLSNIGDWLMYEEEKIEGMARGLTHVMRPDTCVIDASMHYAASTPLSQQVFIGKEYDPLKLRNT